MHDGRTTGTCRYRCGFGTFGNPTKTCVLKSCAAATKENCVLPKTTHGSTGAGSCAEGYVAGTCSASCRFGNFGKPSPICVEPPRQPCAAATLAWSVGGRTCSASAGETVHGGSVSLADAAGSLVGAATFACTDGAWGSATGASCRCLLGQTWVPALPVRARTCTGNTGCTTHTHSCTTPSDGAGGFLPCTYRKHESGVQCAAHTERTCNPYPAVAGHCHDSTPCPLCFEP